MRSKDILIHRMGDLGVIQPKGFPGLPAGWGATSETFLSSDSKTKLFGLILQKEKWTKGKVLFVLHGLGEHGGRYVHLPHFLQSQLDAIYCLDHRGHGRSEGLRGHVECFDELVEDAALALERFEGWARKKISTVELHGLGHSLGGHVALRMAFLKSVLCLRSLTITAPFLGIKAKVPLIKKIAARSLSTLWGTLPLNTDLDTHTLSHDPSVREAYESDRLVHGKMTPRFFTEVQAAMLDTMGRDSGISIPLQMIVPLNDLLVDADQSLQFYQQLKHPDKHLKTYPEFFHEPLNEIGKEKVFEDVSEWIAVHPGVL